MTAFVRISLALIFFERLTMIKNPNSTSLLDNHPALSIKDSLLSDALERNEQTLPPRLMPALLQEHPVSKPADDGERSAS